MTDLDALRARFRELGRAIEVTIVQPRTLRVIRREIWELVEIDGRRYLRVPERYEQPRGETLQIVVHKRATTTS